MVNLLCFLIVDHLSLLALHLLISKNKLRLAIGIQDIVVVGSGGDQLEQYFNEIETLKEENVTLRKDWKRMRPQ